MDIDLNKAKDIAEDAIEKISKDENAKKVANQAINEVEKKVKVDLPDVDGIKKTLGGK
ncbi:MAG: hypothetical protein IJ757_08860 [Clostridiales bacterium]|nr:hypothetical protein [Clostridiales bacterium]